MILTVYGMCPTRWLFFYFAMKTTYKFAAFQWYYFCFFLDIVDALFVSNNLILSHFCTYYENIVQYVMILSDILSL